MIGAGPAGLMAAEVLSAHDVEIAVYDAMPSAGRKFLMAGKGGMNITHAEGFDDFVARYGNRRSVLLASLTGFTPEALRDWVHSFGIETFVGSSGRVFPKQMKAAPLLRAWLQRLRGRGVSFHMRHRWLGWTDQAQLIFENQQGHCQIQADAVILALGGGSWPQLGSNAAWVEILKQRGVAIAPLQPANCGFELSWTDYFRQQFAGQPLKSVVMSVAEQAAQAGELMVTEHGLEGGLIYAFSAAIRQQIDSLGLATIYLDLLPNRSEAAISQRLSRPRGKASFANHLRKCLGIDGVKAALLRETASLEIINDTEQLARHLKAVPIQLLATRPLAEAISSAGGVCFTGLEQNLMLKALPSVFCAGEMLDWEAPTGGYLLTACLATGRTAGLGALAWLQAASIN